MMTEKQANNEEKSKMEFIPFHAINEFMRADYRMTILRSTLLALPELPSKTQASINKLTKKFVKVPGFRNSAKAPASVKAVSMVKAFEKQPKLVSEIIAAWAEANPELGQQIFELLKSYNWQILPLEADRTRLPGFLTQWPEDEDYEKIYDDFTEAYPDSKYGIDDVSLMAVWLSLRLPVEKVSKAEMVDLPFYNELPPEEDVS
jgi:hypothetical protein